MDGAGSDFQAIHEAFRAKVQRYLARLVGEFEAEDLTQEVFIKINRSLGSFRGESSLATWVYQIATHAALDRLRSPAFKQMAPNELADYSELEEMEQDALGEEAAPSPEEQLFIKERYDCYCSFVGNLPVNYRVIVALSDLEDLAANEIADILGLSMAVVKIRLHRGRARLLEALRAHCDPDDWL